MPKDTGFAEDFTVDMAQQVRSTAVRLDAFEFTAGMGWTPPRLGVSQLGNSSPPLGARVEAGILHSPIASEAALHITLLQDQSEPRKIRMVSFQPILDALLKALPPHPVPQHLFDELVTTVLEDTKDGGSAETRKSQWEYLLRKEVFDLAVCLPWC